jgi:hypothetical protein
MLVPWTEKTVDAQTLKTQAHKNQAITLNQGK